MENLNFFWVVSIGLHTKVLYLEGEGSRSNGVHGPKKYTNFRYSPKWPPWTNGQPSESKIPPLLPMLGNQKWLLVIVDVVSMHRQQQWSILSQIRPLSHKNCTFWPWFFKKIGNFDSLFSTSFAHSSAVLRPSLDWRTGKWLWDDSAFNGMRPRPKKRILREI